MDSNNAKNAEQLIDYPRLIRLGQAMYGVLYIEVLRCMAGVPYYVW